MARAPCPQAYLRSGKGIKKMIRFNPPKNKSLNVCLAVWRVVVARSLSFSLCMCPPPAPQTSPPLALPASRSSSFTALALNKPSSSSFPPSSSSQVGSRPSGLLFAYGSCVFFIHRLCCRKSDQRPNVLITTNTLVAFLVILA